MTRPPLAPTLSAQHRQQFHDDGYIVIPGVFDADELDALRGEAARILELVLWSSQVLQRRNPRLDCAVHADGSISVRKVQPVNDLSEVLAAVSGDPRLVAPMAELMDDEPVLMEEKLNYKQEVSWPGGSFSFITRQTPTEGFPLHHDWGYYRQHGYPENTISSAVSLDDCEGRGPLRVIPGSHRLDAPLLDPDPASGNGAVAPGYLADAPRTPIDAPAGSVMLFHAKLLHDSEPNRSGLPRRLMIFSHFPAGHEPLGDHDRRNGPIREYSQAFEQRAREARTLLDG